MERDQINSSIQRTVLKLGVEVLDVIPELLARSALCVQVSIPGPAVAMVTVLWVPESQRSGKGTV